jgi:hypothetical protein
MKDVMLDFETFGNGENKCVGQIGACYFNNSTGEIGKTLKINVDATSHVRKGAIIDADTVYWWLQQSAESRASLIPDRVDVTQAFLQLNDFLAEAKRVWSHATFDFVTLMDTFKMLGIKPTISYKAGMDLRTLVYLAGEKVNKIAREGTHHYALDDCFHQVKYCVKSLNAVKTSKLVLSFIERMHNE